MRKPCLLALAAALAALAVPSAADAMSAPRLVSPGNGAQVQQLPALTWNSVRGAAVYEYEVSADSRFNSIALGRGLGKGVSHTYNLAAALDKTVADGTYYWRVRGLTAAKTGALGAQCILTGTGIPAPLRPIGLCVVAGVYRGRARSLSGRRGRTHRSR